MGIDLRCKAAILMAKTVQWLCKHTGTSGTSLPGMMALRVDPNMLKKLSSGFRVIAVTGTNGKTTTTGMISRILEANGIPHITNRSGANMIMGIATAFAEHVDLKGNSPYKWAVLEVDEATVQRFCSSVQPEALIVTNFFRDQLDRYGEVYSVADAILAGVRKVPGVKLILNADDSLCASLGVRAERESVYFGFEPGAAPASAENNISTTSYCLFCHGKYEYSYRVLGHLGGFRCTECGFQRPEPAFKCLKVEDVRQDHSDFLFDIAGETHEVRVDLPGMFNGYNALAAAACCHTLGFPFDVTAKVLANMESCFGRMESISVPGDKRILMMLVKNPVGFNQILRYLLDTDGTFSAAFLINDKYQDGTDISWLWDVDFEQLSGAEEKIERLYASGVRGEDMAVRLKYAGFPLEKVRLQKDFEELIREGLAELPAGGTLYLAATYTAMMESRASLKKKFDLKEIWQ